jgi:uncharacterized protein YjbI with pentapeptide repeats
MTKKELINRWKSKEGQQRLEGIIRAFSKNIPLSSIDGLEKYSGRWDLRGAKFSMIVKQQEIKSEGYGFVRKTGILKIRNATIESIDFSFADISYSLFEKSAIKNCLFEETTAKELRIVACKINNCIFRKSDLSYSYLNQNMGSKSGSFVNVEFVEADLKEVIFCFPLMEYCKFINCNLNATNFDGSRMKNCKFIGKVDSPWFSGYSLNANKSILGIFNRVDPKCYPNLMENVDFSEATLIGVSFRNNINLTNCLFPKDENYILIQDIRKTFLMAKEKIALEWEAEDKRIGIHMIDSVYFTKAYQSQNMTLIDKYLLLEQFGAGFADRFFKLINSLNSNRN